MQNLYGQHGDDTYVVSADSGRVRISHWAETAETGYDRVVFRDIEFADVAMTSYDYGDADGERMIISWYKDGLHGEVQLAHMGAFIESLEFADGFVTNPAGMIYGLPQIVGTDQADTLRGTNVAEHLIGGDGTDHLQAAGGDDVLDPGAGDTGYQYLYGQAGNDTYLIGHDVGTARINIWSESATNGASDMVHFTDLLFSEVTATHYHGSGADGTELRLTWDVGGVTGTLQLAEFGDHIETYQFADGFTATSDDFVIV